MPVIQLETHVQAPPEICFDLSRSIDLHVKSTDQTQEKAVAGVTTGLIGLGEEVTWHARHFGVWQYHTTRITAFDFPRHFQDTMVKGTFRRVVHDHHFEPQPGGATRMISRFDYTSPLGILGVLADRLFLKAYMTRFLETRNQLIKEIAESDQWPQYVSDEHRIAPSR